MKSYALTGSSFIGRFCASYVFRTSSQRNNSTGRKLPYLINLLPGDMYLLSSNPVYKLSFYMA